MITNDTVETTETKEERRKRQLREAKQKQRERDRQSGRWTYAVTLDAGQQEYLRAAAAMYRGSNEEFMARALVLGAKFLANSGNVKGGKARLK